MTTPTPRISAILAVAENGVIGRHNQMPWHLPADFKYFKKITMGNPIIMGRKTFESIGKALPGRTNIIISRNPAFSAADCLCVESIEAAVELAKREEPDEIFIAGGGSIYLQALPLIQRIYRTLVHVNPIGDAFFELPAPQEWKLISEVFRPADSKNLLPVTFQILERV